MNLKNQDFLSVNQLNKKSVLEIFKLALKFEKAIGSNQKLTISSGKILATCFFEASTRTRLSFEAATLRLGGQVLSMGQVEQTSLFAKGESFEDTIRIIDGYADLLVIRHPKTGFVKIAADAAQHPVINAGDGGEGEHPTQALLDFYTIWKNRGNTKLGIGILGDLKYGRTVHSLVPLLDLFGYKFIFISHQNLCLPKGIKIGLKNKYLESSDLEKYLPDLDVLYVTRVQKERFKNLKEYQEVKNLYQINDRILSIAKKNLIIMHPLPRVYELDPEIDKDPRAHYFQQAENGVYVRMALIAKILGLKD